MEHTASVTTFAWLAASLGLLALSIPLLLTGAADSTRAPLVGFLCCSGIANALPALIEISPLLELYSLAIFLPLYLAMPVCLWLYADAITSTTPWRIQRKMVLHFVPTAAAMIVATLLALLPDSTLQELLKGDQFPTDRWARGVVICAFGLMVVWLLQSAAYVFAVLVKLLRYRNALQHLFANNEQRELHWLSWIVIMLAVTWALSLFFSIPLLTDQALPLPVEIMAAMHFGLLWALSLFGARQKPGFAGRYLNDEQPLEAITAPRKYQKSGLKQEELTRIAGKIEDAMHNRKLYLDATLSLPKLAGEIQVPANYVSQTLNETLDKTFFDYVNGWRIQHALPEVLEARKTVLDIAMDAGFNARSSFYKAFKHETGHTPGGYRKHLEHSAK